MIIKGIIPKFYPAKDVIGREITLHGYKVGVIDTAKVTKDKQYIEYTATINSVEVQNKIKNGTIKKFKLK